MKTSELGDILVARGPFRAGGLIPHLWRFPSAQQMNDLREELLEARDHRQRIEPLRRQRNILHEQRDLWRSRAITAGWTGKDDPPVRSPGPSS